MAVETVSLCVVALNEEKFLPNLLNDLSRQTYPREKTEIVLIDSGSSDGTPEIMESFRQQHSEEFLSVQVLPNPGGIQASGWNVAIRNFKGDVMIRIDAHTHIPEEFTARNMKNLREGEFISGGIRPCLIEGSSPWKKLLLQTENSLFGSSIGRSGGSRQKEYVKTFFHAAYRREVFEKVGLFNENLLRTEDNELHYRMRQAGYRFALDPEIVSYQYARSDFRRMIRQKYSNGYWIGLTLSVCPGCISLYHLVPFVFLLAIAATTVLAMAGWWGFAAVMWGLYLLFGLAGTVSAWVKDGFHLNNLLMPVLFLILHCAYGLGTLVGICSIPRWKKTLR